MSSARVVFGFLLLSAIGAAQQYVISTCAGGAPSPVPALATDLFIGFGSGVAADAAGNVYFASATLPAIFKLDTGGRLTRVAGTSRPGYGGDGGPATSARLRLGFLGGLAVDEAVEAEKEEQFVLAVDDFRNHHRPTDAGGICIGVPRRIHFVHRRVRVLVP